MIKKTDQLLKKNSEILSIIFLVSIAFVLRLDAAQTQSFWLDEVLNFHTSQSSVLDLLLMRTWDTMHTQIHYIVLHYLQQINSSEVFLRLPSVLAAIPATYFFYKIARKTSKSNVAAFLATAIFAVHPYLINVGFQAKSYGLFICFYLGALYYLQKYLVDRKPLVSLGLSVLFAALAFYTDYAYVWHHFSLLVTIGVLTIKNTGPIKKLFSNFFLISLLLLPQVPLFFNTVTASIENQSYLQISNASIDYAYYLFSGLFSANVYFLTYLLIFSVVLVAYKNRKSSFELLLIISSTLPIFASFLVSQHSPIMNPRNLIIVPIVLILLSAKLISKYQNKYMIFLVLMVIISMFNDTLNRKLFVGMFDWKSFRNQIVQNTGRPVILFLYRGDTATFSRLDSLTRYYLSGHDMGPIIPNYVVRKINLDEEVSQSLLLRYIYDENIWILQENSRVNEYEPDSKEKIEYIQNLLNCENKSCKNIIKI